MNNSQVAHLWANQSRPSGKGSNFYFTGDTIYSYGPHFPIARLYKNIVLFTNRDYSVTTCKHKRLARRAADHKTIFYVNDPTRNPSRADIKSYKERISKLAESASRARDPKWKLLQLQSTIEEANLFCEEFGFKTRFSMPDESMLATLRERCKIAAARKAKQTAKRNALLEEQDKSAIAEWLSGTSNFFPYRVNTVMLRRNGDWMQTSKGAFVQLPEAKRAFEFVTAKRPTGWHRNGEPFKVGDFQLESVNDFGVVAGCHRIAWDEIERFAKTQGWV